MSRPKSTPAYCFHRQSGHAYVTIAGKQHWLGKHGTAESRAAYDRLIGEWLVNGRRAPTAAVESASPSVSAVLAAFLDHARSYYSAPDAGTVDENNKPVNKPTGEYINFVHAMRPIRRLYGCTPAAEFGPLALKAVREEMIHDGLCRNVINRRIGRIKAIFKWAVTAELIAPSIHLALAAVPGLRAGRSEARESAPVKPVADHIVDATLPHLSPTVAAMVKLQRLTGARPGEICQLRTGEIDRSDHVWTYRPARHKTMHLGRERLIFFGPKSQELLRPFLKMDPAAYVFSPADADRKRREKMHEDRIATGSTPLSCGNKPGTNRKCNPLRKPGNRYGTSAYAFAIKRACEAAFAMPADLKERPERDESPEAMAKWKEAMAKWKQARKAWRAENVWSPNRLRHLAGTRLRREYGIEGAQVMLGHARVETTQIYAEKNSDAARKIAASIG